MNAKNRSGTTEVDMDKVREAANEVINVMTSRRMELLERKIMLLILNDTIALLQTEAVMRQGGIQYRLMTDEEKRDLAEKEGRL